ncbi:hypothetical protein [Sandarakinorhabdus rubra]|uniref:hypothetical protein n=1 Tax=Sandarakinorhabdus rubra TaxID=2672568 RepID=UPI0013DA7DCA|nr:hypothetical protein [Sandarakinorhabdus rubra]
MKRLNRSAAMAAALIAATPAIALPTPVVVRVLSQGAKFIGDGMGGVQVELADATTGKSLGKGLVKGGTGDTARIMNGAPRGQRIADESAGSFATLVDIAEPTNVRVTISGPMKAGISPVTLTTTRWLIPGQGLAGDGWLLELQGLAMSARREGDRVVADVSMLCGCPIAAGSLWDEKRFRVLAWADGKAVPLSFAGQTGRFAGTVPAGTTWVTAMDVLSGATSAVKLNP